RTETGEVKGPADFRRLVYDPIRQAFPDIRIKIDALIGEGNEVAMRWTAFAKHAGELAGLAATGRSVRMSGMTGVEFRDGKIVRGYDSYNLHGLMAYLSSGQESASVGPA